MTIPPAHTSRWPEVIDPKTKHLFSFSRRGARPSPRGTNEVHHSWAMLQPSRRWFLRSPDALCGLRGRRHRFLSGEKSDYLAQNIYYDRRGWFRGKILFWLMNLFLRILVKSANNSYVHIVIHNSYGDIDNLNCHRYYHYEWTWSKHVWWCDSCTLTAKWFAFLHFSQV